MKRTTETINPALEAAIKAIAGAESDIAAHKGKMDNLRNRINELDTAITECRVKATETPVLADMTIDAIRLMAGRKSAALGEIDALEEVKGLVAKELNELAEQERWIAGSRGEAVKAAWSVLFNQMLESMPTKALHDLVSIGYLCGIPQKQIISVLLPDSYDASALEVIANQYGLPL